MRRDLNCRKLCASTTKISPESSHWNAGTGDQTFVLLRDKEMDQDSYKTSQSESDIYRATKVRKARATIPGRSREQSCDESRIPEH